jgi:hypothetical protein
VIFYLPLASVNTVNMLVVPFASDVVTVRHYYVLLSWLYDSLVLYMALWKCYVIRLLFAGLGIVYIFSVCCLGYAARCIRWSYVVYVACAGSCAPLYC